MPNERCRPASEPAPTTTATVDTAEFSAPWRQDRSEPLTADDRADIAILNAAAERGFRLAVRCTRCHQWLVAPSSVRRHLGPVCAQKVAADEGVA
ncbi:DUF6011 domain-containing protein [Mycobacterium marinum]|uniref:DUF6011 domain-containing protein n=1 Tax=Mycobacterium marinum TaxID=1781 RepID=UPI0023584498|nr:DUF6011 domain-containing protein [Mycobacterium marinum]MDC9015123.1 DUF6011 domain-containing protein [Mycobacterium marinum]